MREARNIAKALKVLSALGFPREQLNERSALCLLALLNLTRGDKWETATAPLIGITPMMEFAFNEYGRKYAPNTRETFRRQTMHQFVASGMAPYNPDNPSRAVNSPKAVYQIEPEALKLVRSFGSGKWPSNLKTYLSVRETLIAQYAKQRNQSKIPVRIAPKTSIHLSPGAHSELIKTIIEDFGSRFVPDGILVYAGDTGEKWGYFDAKVLAKLGIALESHGKMPDVILYCPRRNWLLLIESVTSHGPVDGKRHKELSRIFESSSAGLVYVTAFPLRALMTRYLPEIAWETEVWVADAPFHLIHFNGSRFLGPYE